MVRKDCVSIVAAVLSKYLMAFHFAKEAVHPIKGPYTEVYTTKTTVIPLPVMNLNEQHYGDVVQILEFYEELYHKICKKAGVPHDKIVIGGDQLTRERFSGAKNLRMGNGGCAEFEHLSPIVMEFFHLGMNYLEKVIFR